MTGLSVTELLWELVERNNHHSVNWYHVSDDEEKFAIDIKAIFLRVSDRLRPGHGYRDLLKKAESGIGGIVDFMEQYHKNLDPYHKDLDPYGPSGLWYCIAILAEYGSDYLVPEDGAVYWREKKLTDGSDNDSENER